MMGRVGFVNRTVYYSTDEYYRYFFQFTDRAIIEIEKKWQEHKVRILVYDINEGPYFERWQKAEDVMMKVSRGVSFF